MFQIQEQKITNKLRFEKEIKELETRIKELEEEKKQKQEKIENLKDNKEKFTKELEEKEKELEEITHKLSSKELQIEEHKKKVEENVDIKYELQANINEQDINYQNYEKRQVIYLYRNCSVFSFSNSFRNYNVHVIQNFRKIRK